jgi:hypothetical protein
VVDAPKRALGCQGKQCYAPVGIGQRREEDINSSASVSTLRQACGQRFMRSFAHCLVRSVVCMCARSVVRVRVCARATDHEFGSLRRLTSAVLLVVVMGSLTEMGRVYTWGAGNSGSLGHGETTDQITPRLVEELRGTRTTTNACNSTMCSLLS